MNIPAKALCALCLFLLLVGFIFAFPAKEALDEFFGISKEEMSTEVKFYDEEGNLVDVPLAITAGGAEVESMMVTVTWTVEGENLKPNTFNIHGEIKIGLVDQNTGKVNSIGSYAFDSSSMVPSNSRSWVLADLLPMSGQSIGWVLEIAAIPTPTATDIEGNPVAPGSTTTSPISATLAWDSQTGTLDITKCDVTKAYP